jgi:hydroxypyruvate reductase
MLRAALDSVDPFEAVHQIMKLRNNTLFIGKRRINLTEDIRVFVVGAGKAGIAMAKAVEEILGDYIRSGIISVPHLPAEPLSTIQFKQGGHPLPSEGSIEAGVQIETLLSGCSEKDLVLVLISGGGSALLELPMEGLSLSDLQLVNDLLIKSGAPIHDINAVRRQLSLIKGGGMARLAAPAQTFALILSDVVGDRLEAIASGPTTFSTTSVRDVWEILERYNLISKIPDNVKYVLKKLPLKERDQTADKVGSVENFIIGSNEIAARASVDQAEELGFRAMLLTTSVQGEAREVGRIIAKLVKSVELSPTDKTSPICIVLGGETTVTVRGEGVGGRNQELALAAALELEGVPNAAMMTLATDGVDGPTTAAGAVVTGNTIPKARSLDLNGRAFLLNNDSHSFFDALGDAVTLGSTGTNVNDLIFCLVYTM